MGVMKKRMEDRMQRRQDKKTQQGASNGIFTWHPTSEQKDFLREGGLDWFETFEVLTGALNRGLKITLGMRLENGSVYAIAREGGTAWDSSRAVSVWHAEPGPALRALAYYLRDVNPHFPEGLGDDTRLKFDW